LKAIYSGHDYYTEYNITSYSCIPELGPIPVVVTAYGLVTFKI